MEDEHSHGAGSRSKKGKKSSTERSEVTKKNTVVIFFFPFSLINQYIKNGFFFRVRKNEKENKNSDLMLQRLIESDPDYPKVKTLIFISFSSSDLLSDQFLFLF